MGSEPCCLAVLYLVLWLQNASTPKNWVGFCGLPTRGSLNSCNTCLG